jgi:hypothetical protein
MERRFVLEFLLILISLVLSIFYSFVFATPVVNEDLTFNIPNPHCGEAILAYAQWNESVNSTFIEYANLTTYYNYTNTTPVVGNWTNFTIVTECNTSAWSRGIHYAKIYVNSTEQNPTNSTNSSTNNFALWGWAEVNESSYVSSVDATIPINLSCRVKDANTTTALQNYNVSFYDNTSLIGYNYTNSTGWATVTYTQSTGGLYQIRCNITDNTTGYYNTTSITRNIGYLTVNPVLIVNVTNLTSKDFGNATINLTSTSWVNTTFRIYFANGTAVENNTIFSYSNITNVWLFEPNASYTFPSNKNLSFENYAPGTTPPSTKDWLINVTVPAGAPGGRYQVHINLTSKDGKYLGESAYNNSLIVYDSGFYMTPLDSLSSVTVGSDVYYNVTVKNFGPSAGSTKILFSNNGCAYVTITASSNNCGSTIESNTFIFSMSAYNYSGCWFRFKIHGVAVGDCSGMYVNGTAGNWFNNIPNLYITVSSNATTTTEPSLPPLQNETPPAPKYLNITSYPSLVLVTEGATNSTTVTVKNINSTRSQDVRLTVENINSTWFTVTPTPTTTISPLSSKDFTVTFSIPNNTEIKDYSAKFTAISNYANVSKTFTLRVLPGEETKAEINATLASFEQNMTKLWEEISQSAASGLNVSAANSTFIVLKALVNQTRTYVNEGDYISALYLFNNIRSLFDTIRAQLNQTTQEEEAKKWFKLPTLQLPSGAWLYALVFGGVAAVIIVIIYLIRSVETEKEKLPLLKPMYIPKEEKKKEDVLALLREKWGKFSKPKEEPEQKPEQKKK